MVDFFRLLSRFIAIAVYSLSIVTMAIVLGWAGEQYHWHMAVAPSLGVAYAIIVFAALKPRTAKKVVTKK